MAFEGDTAQLTNGRPSERPGSESEFLEDYWYAAASAEEISREPLQRWLLGQPLVFWRRLNGTPVALADRCPHRSAPLSKGRLNGDELVCGYHGLTFSADGKCTRVPGLKSPPSGFCTRSYPIVERWGWAFVWMGNPDLADPASIPDLPWLTSPEWAGRGERLPVAAHHSLIRDNLLDLTHAHYLHARTLATDAVLDYPISTRTEGNTVIVSREMPNIETSPFFKKIGGFDGKVNHRQEIEFKPPSNVVIRVTVSDVANSAQRVEARVVNVLTPETMRSTHYFWSVLRNKNVQDEALTEWVFEAIKRTFDEDVDMIEAQQQLIDRTPPNNRPLRWHVDKGIEQVTRSLRRL